MEKFVVTISRQFGSMGRTIAAKMSEILGIDYLDRDIVAATAERMGQTVKVISNGEETAKKSLPGKLFLFNMGVYSITDEIFAVEKNIIRDMASKESCILKSRYIIHRFAQNQGLLRT